MQRCCVLNSPFFLGDSVLSCAVAVQVKRALGVPPGVHWKACNFMIDVDFAISGDWLSDSSHVVERLLERGVPVLAYSGDRSSAREAKHGTSMNYEHHQISASIS